MEQFGLGLHCFQRTEYTVNLEIFVEIKSSRIGKITLSFTDISKSRPCREFLTSQICVLTLFCKNKILSKFSKFTVPSSAF